MELGSRFKPPNCSICLKPLTVNGNEPYYGNKKPFLLYCGHSACENCLHSVFERSKEVVCKVCQSVSSVPDNFSLDDLAKYFPVNWFLLGFWATDNSLTIANELDASIKFTQSSNPLKDRHRAVLCNECMTTSAEFMCKQCAAPYCELCFKQVHLSARAFRNHVKGSLNDNAQEIEPEQSLMCSIHVEAKLEFYCLQCCVPSCPRCMVEKHQGHNLDLLENVKENCEEEFIERYVKVTNILQRMKSSQQKVDHIIQQNRKTGGHLKKIHNKIFETFIHIHGKLIMLQHSIHTKLSSVDEISELEALLKTLNESINSTESLLTSTKVLLKDLSHQKPSNYIAVIDNLKKKEGLPCFLVEMPRASHPTFTVNEDVINDLIKICDVNISMTPKYLLSSENDLPSGYEIQPVIEVSRNEVMNLVYSTASSDIASVSSDSFSDKVVFETNHTPSSPNYFMSNQETTNSDHTVPTCSEELSNGCQVRVHLSHLISPSDFYVQREYALQKLLDFQISLRSTNLKNHKIPARLIKGQIYLALYEKDSNWYRARILEYLEDNQFRVFYIDFGNLEIVSRNRIRGIPKHVCNMPVLAMRCKLNNCVPINDGEWNPEALALMTKIIDNEPMTMVVRDRTPLSYIVDLYKISDHSIINIQQALCFFEYATIAAECEWNVIPSFPTQTEVQLPKQKFREGDVLEVYVSQVVSPNEIYVQNLLTSKRLIKMTDELNKMCQNPSKVSNQNVYHPKIGLYVFAKYSKDKKWYRGRITEILKDKLLKIFFIDFGGEEIVPWKDVKLLNTRFTKLPPQAIKCDLSDILPPSGQDVWDAKTCTYLCKVIFKKKMKIIVHQVHEDHLSIVMYQITPEVDVCVNAILVRESRAISTGENSTVVDHRKVMSVHKQLEIAVEKSKTVMKSSPVETDAMSESNKLLSYTLKGPDGSLRTHVSVKHLVNPGEFYVGFKFFEDSLLKLEKDLQTHYSTVNYDPGTWDQENVIAVQYQNKWYRAFILENLPEDKFKVTLVDEGLEVVIEICHTAPLLEEFKSEKDGAVRCHLGGLEPTLPNGWACRATEEMKEFCFNNKDILYITRMGEFKNESMPVELFAKKEKPASATEPVKTDWQSLNHYLRHIGLAKSDGKVEWDCDGTILNLKEILTATESKSEILGKMQSLSLKITSPVPGRSENEIETLKQNDITKEEERMDVVSLPDAWIPAKPLEKLSFVCCPTYVDTDLNIYFHDYHESSKVLEQISSLLSVKYDGVLPKPCDTYYEKGDICIVRYHLDKKWYRGVILEAFPDIDEYEIRFIDYGNVETCDLSDIRKIPVCHHIPIQASKGHFSSIEPANSTGLWTTKTVELTQFNLVDFHCLVELKDLKQTDNYEIKKIIRPDGIEFIPWLVKEDQARFKKRIKSCSSDENEKNLKVGSVETTKKRENEVEELKNDTISKIDGNKVLEESISSSPKIVDWFTLSELDSNASENDESSKPNDIVSNEDDEKHTLDVKTSESDPDEVENASVAEEDVPLSDLFFHWPTYQEMYPIEGNVKYKEFVIPSAVNTLLVEPTAYHTSTIIVVHLKAIEGDSEISEKVSNYSELSRRLQEEGPQQPPLSEPYKFKVCCAQFSADEQWYRAIVADICSNGEFLVQFVDFGNVEILPASSVRELKEEWAELEVLGLLCQLDNVRVSPNASNTKVMSVLSNTLESKGELTAIVKKRNPILKVALYSDNTLAYEDLIKNDLFIQLK